MTTPTPTRTGPQTGVTLYSFTNEWLTRQFELDTLLAEVARRGLGPNIEIIGFQSFRDFPDVSDAFADEFGQMMADNGLKPVSCAINSDRFLKPGQQPIEDAALVEYHARQLRSAKKLGFSLVRYQFALPVHLLPEVSAHAEQIDIRMGVEVHAPMWAGHPAVQAYGEMYDKLDTPVLGWIPDFGGTASRIPESMLDAARAKGAREDLLDKLKEVWLEDGMSHEKAGRLREWGLAHGHDPLHIQAACLASFILANHDPKSWAALVDRTIHIHGKFYGVGEDLVEEAIDYDTILPLFKDGGFTGTMVSEWEGHAYDTRDAFEQVRRHQAMARRIWGPEAVAYELSINLEYGFTEAGERIEDRIAAAAAAGFAKVELFLLKGRDLASIKAALDAHGVQLVSTVADYVTQLVDPATHEGFCATFREAAQAARSLGCRNVVVTSGRGVPWLKRPVQLGIFADALRMLVPIAEVLEVTILLESANTRHDHPGVLCSTTGDSAAVVEMVASPRVRLLYDLYHSVVEGEDPAVVLPPVVHLVDHVQVADAPGRGEPGSGGIDWPAQLALLRRLGYAGTIGLEMQPTGDTAQAVRYFQQLCAAA